MNDTETLIKNYSISLGIADDKIKIILNNCKINNTLSQFIKLLIKFNINLFEKHNPIELKKHNKLLYISKKHKKNLIVGHGVKVMRYAVKENSIENIENNFNKLKKEINDIDLVIYILQNIYNSDEILLDILNLSHTTINLCEPIKPNKPSKSNELDKPIELDYSNYIDEYEN
jgi:hypothetical protein